MESYQSLQSLTISQFTDLFNNILDKKLTVIKNEIDENVKNKQHLVTIKTLTETLLVSKPTIYNWIKKGLIKRQKIGGKVLFDLPLVLKTLKTNEYAFGKGREYAYTKI